MLGKPWFSYEMSEEINITFLGTSQAIPTAKRNHTAMLLKYKNENILIDCGEGTQRQFRKAKLNPCKLTKILITHWHGDHILGLPGLFQTLLLNGYNRNLEIYGPKGTNYYINQIIKLFVPYSKLKITIKEISSNTKFFENKDFYLESIPMQHGIPSNAYSFVEKDRLRLNKEKLKKLKLPNNDLISKLAQGKNITIKNKTIKASTLTYEQKGRKITIIMDTELNPNCKKIAKNSDLLITEAVYLNNEKDLAKLHQHLTAEQAAQIAKSSNSKKLILAHLSQRYDCSENLILKESKKNFKDTTIAEDLMKVGI